MTKERKKMEGEKGPQTGRKGKAQEEAGALKADSGLRAGLGQWTAVWAQRQQHELHLGPEFDKQILGPHPRSTGSETLGMGPRSLLQQTRR